MTYSPEVRNRVIFLMDRVTNINRDTDNYATFQLDGFSLRIWVKDKNGGFLLDEIIFDLTEAKTYEIYMKLDAITEKESATIKDRT